VSVPKAISDRRDHDRIHSISLEIVLDGIRYPAIDWSLGGVLVANYYGVRTLGDEIHGSFRICSDMNSHPFKAVVVRYNDGRATSSRVPFSQFQSDNGSGSFHDGPQPRLINPPLAHPARSPDDRRTVLTDAKVSEAVMSGLTRRTARTANTVCVRRSRSAARTSSGKRRMLRLKESAVVRIIEGGI
jgi:hypothetical protein